jgi:HD superfamily phosphohydrolase YqeK
MRFEHFKAYLIAFLNEKLSEKLYYHNIQHTLEVLHNSQIIALAENCSEHEIELLKTAAILHDSGFTEQYLNNEKNAINLATILLPKFNFSFNEMEIITSIIASTEVKFLPVTNLQKILKDADYYNFGSEHYTISANNLRCELDKHGIIYSDKEWIKTQINFLEKHQFYTNTANKLWFDKKQENLLKLKQEIIL